MNHVLVLVSNDADARALPKVINFLSPLKPKAVVVLNNPSVGITSESATTAVDEKIRTLEKAKSDAVAREDFPAASQYKDQIEDAKMERADALRDGWKSVSEQDRIAVYDKLVQPFKNFPFVQSITLPEDSAPENMLATLAGFGVSWPEYLPHGRFSLIWPQDMPEIVAQKTQESVSSAPKVNTAPPAKKAAVAPLEPRAAREKELGKYMKLKAEAKKYGISMEGRLSKDVVAEIIAREFGAVAA